MTAVSNQALPQESRRNYGLLVAGSASRGTELAVTKRAVELLKGKVVHRKRRYEAIATMRTGRLSTQVACRVLGVSQSGFYARVVPASVGPFYSSRVAHRHHLSDPSWVTRCVWSAAGACRTYFGSWDHSGAQRGSNADEKSRNGRSQWQPQHETAPPSCGHPCRLG